MCVSPRRPVPHGGPAATVVLKHSAAQRSTAQHSMAHSPEPSTSRKPLRPRTQGISCRWGAQHAQCHQPQQLPQSKLEGLPTAMTPQPSWGGRT